MNQGGPDDTPNSSPEVSAASADVTKALAGLEDTIRSTLDTLVAIDAPEESLGELRAPRRFWPLRPPPILEPVGTVWRLGVLLIDREGQLFSTGQVTRAIEPLRAVTNRSQAAELRREYRRAAARGHFVTGEVVNHDFVPIDLDPRSLVTGAGALSIVGDAVMVRWDAGNGANGISRLDRYLADRVSLFSLD